MSKYLFNHSHLIFQKIFQTGFIFLFLDYDGTLIPFEKRPTDVITPEKIIRIIEKLIKNPRIDVIIVTGRELHDIKKLLNINELKFIALHGLYIDTPDGIECNLQQKERTKRIIQIIKGKMQCELKDVKGAYLEDKELTLAFHYRLVNKGRIPTLKKKFEELARNTDKEKTLEVIKGEKVLEARPKGWDKGKAIETFLAQYSSSKDIIPIYIGDDITDEDAFRSIEKQGISIYVANQSKRKTAAQFWLKNYEEVFSFLQCLSQALHDE